MLEMLIQNAEILGILALIFTLVSFLLTGERYIRRVNIVGAVLFVVYGLLINSPSVVLLNAALVVTHSYKLYQLRKRAAMLESRLKTVFTFDNKQIHKINKEDNDE